MPLNDTCRSRTLPRLRGAACQRRTFAATRSHVERSLGRSRLWASRSGHYARSSRLSCVVTARARCPSPWAIRRLLADSESRSERVVQVFPKLPDSHQAGLMASAALTISPIATRQSISFRTEIARKNVSPICYSIGGLGEDLREETT